MNPYSNIPKILRRGKNTWSVADKVILLWIIVALVFIACNFVPFSEKAEASAVAPAPLTNEDYCANLGAYRLGDDWREIISYCLEGHD